MSVFKCKLLLKCIKFDLYSNICQGGSFRLRKYSYSPGNGLVGFFGGALRLLKPK